LYLQDYKDILQQSNCFFLQKLVITNLVFAAQ